MLSPVSGYEKYKKQKIKKFGR